MEKALPHPVVVDAVYSSASKIRCGAMTTWTAANLHNGSGHAATSAFELAELNILLHNGRAYWNTIHECLRI
jgi:hypothetical protein